VIVAFKIQGKGLSIVLGRGSRCVGVLNYTRQGSLYELNSLSRGVIEDKLREIDSRTDASTKQAMVGKLSVQHGACQLLGLGEEADSGVGSPCSLGSIVKAAQVG